MTTKLQTLNAIDRTGAVLILRLDNAEEAYRASEAAIEGGITTLEVTLSVPGALGVIERLADRYTADGIVIGAGTVLDAESAHSCVSAGATLLVSPHLNRGLLAYANRHQIVTISGAYTATEIVDSLEAGADIVKLFPAEFGGVDYARTLLAPLSHAPLLPAGGVNVDNVGDWFEAGVVAVGVGSAISKAARKDGDYKRVTAAAREFLSAVSEARGR